jgi:exopolyphosphatase/guanosine-5'-triphosphate,3'-diphosphate pyrophosphatase
MPRYAAIDIGSNSVRMLAAEANFGDSLVTLAEGRQVTRLGESVFATGSISQEAMDLVCGELARMSRTIAKHHVLAMRAVATAAVRDASNQKVFLQRASEAIGSTVEVISGQEEARLIHLGVQSRWPHDEKRTLIVDIGGGSTELIQTDHGQFREAFSKPLGAVRLTELFLKHDPPTPSELARLQEFIEERMAPAVERFRRKHFDRVIATAGTAAAVVCAANGIARATREAADRKRASLAQIRRLSKELSVLPLAKRRRIPGIGPRRAEIIVPGLAVFQYVLEVFHQPALYYSVAGLRDGIIADLWQRNAGAEKTQLNPSQRKVVEHLGERFGVNLKHARTIADLAHSLFVSLQPLHRLPAATGRLLEASAYLLDSGHFISDTGHHKHSEYIVANAELPGFTQSERRIIAALCRFHRKSMPGTRHLSFQSMPVEDRRVAILLIPLLRLADALDRGKEQRVKNMHFQVNGEAVRLIIEARGGVDLEYWASERVAEIFRETYGHSLTVALQ